MSVPSWMRNESRVQFLYNVFLLEKEIASIIPKVPSKYRDSFGDTLIHDCDTAFFHGRIANRVRVDNNAVKLRYRKDHLIQMIAAIDNVALHTYVWLETVRAHDGIEKRLDAKLYNAEDRIGNLCNETIALIEGVIHSDEATYKTKREGNKA